MKTLNTLIQKYLIYAFPIVLATMTWGFFQTDSEIRAMGSTGLALLWDLMSGGLILWFACLVTFMIFLVFRPETQESTVTILAGIKERDEREQVIMAMAARQSFFATTALLIFLLFLSCFTLNLARLPEQAIDGKKSSLTIGFHLAAKDSTSSRSSDGSFLEHHDLPISKSAILLLVLVWQMGAFRLSARRLLRS